MARPTESVVTMTCRRLGGVEVLDRPAVGGPVDGDAVGRQGVVDLAQLVVAGADLDPEVVAAHRSGRRDSMRVITLTYGGATTHDGAMEAI